MTAPVDPHGQAALMLCESLALLLIQNGVIQKDQLVEAINGIIEVKQEIAGTSEDAAISKTSIGLLQVISCSLTAASPDRV